MKSLNQVFKEKYYLSDGGLETTLIFHQNIPLNYFAAFELLRNGEGRKVLEEYYKPYLSLAEKYQLGFVIESPTWRSNADWGFKLVYTHDELFALNKQSIKFIRELAAPFTSLSQVVVSGNIGPRRSEEHTSELQSLAYLVCRLLLEKKNKKIEAYLNLKQCYLNYSSLHQKSHSSLDP